MPLASLHSYLLVALGSAIGGAARYWCSVVVAPRAAADFPWATLFVNALGSVLIGVLGAMSAAGSRAPLGDAARQFLMVGVLGGYTTFSAFSLQTFDLLRAGNVGYALANIAASVVLCLLAVWVGYALAKSFW
jgi:fluoride exporter